MGNQDCNYSPWVKVNNNNEFAQKLNKYKIGHYTVFGPSESIYFQNEESEILYYLKSGRIKAYILQENGLEKILSIHEPGSFFGETSTMDHMPRPCSTTAMVNSEVVALKLSDLEQLMHLDSEMYMYILRSLAQKVRLLSYQVQDMAFLEADKRVAHLLLRLANDFGTVTPNGIKLSINFTDQDLAGLVGTCRVTVTRILNEFKKQGLIHKGYRNITITNQVELFQYLYTNQFMEKKKSTLKVLTQC